jgi:hypothetical protein
MASPCAGAGSARPECASNRQFADMIVDSLQQSVSERLVGVE